MRNLKKVLALVLSLVMALSMVTIASAYEAAPGTSFTDDKAITEFDEAVQVLEALGVFQGREDGSLDPTAPITRAEAAAVVYRAITGDVTDANVAMFADDFVDVDHKHWAAGYIGYCANHGIMKGFEDGTFRPNANVTGYQVMAMVLRAIGYNSYNEFTGGDWQQETASYWNLAGITNSVNQAALRKDAPRAMVGEIVFRAIVEASTVKYNALYKYENTNMTKAYEVFGLFGGTDAAADVTYNSATATITIGSAILPEKDTLTSDNVNYAYDANDLEAMTERATAKVDLTNLEVRYGEPVAYWLKDANKDGTAEGIISVLFNPKKTYTVAVTDETLYLDSGLANATKTNTFALDNTVTSPITTGYYTVDGVADATVTLQNDPVGTGNAVTTTGKGVLTNLYVVEGIPFVTSMYTYVGDIAVARYLDTTDGKYYVDLGDNAATLKTLDAAGKTTGMKAGTVVLYTEYAGNLDIANVKAATSSNVIVTNSYITHDDNKDVAKSYFIAGQKYEYDATYANQKAPANGTIESLQDLVSAAPQTGMINDGLAVPGDLTDYLLDREQLIKGKQTAQTIYFDDYGYVIFSTTAVVNPTTGYMVVTSGTYGGLRADNQFVVDFKGYNQDGTAMTISGGLGLSYYNDANEARAYGDAPIAVYYYAKDETGLYSLDSRSDVLTVALNGVDGTRDTDIIWVDDVTLAGKDILAGDADALSDDNLLDDNTVFVIAKYNDYGVITGYDVIKGFKNIPDLYDAELVGANGVDVDYEAYYTMEADTLVDGLDADKKDIDLVVILGAAQQANELESIPTEEVFYLLDVTPEEQYNLYDLHEVIVDGAKTTRKLVKGLSLEEPIVTGQEALYTVKKVNASGYIREVEAATLLADQVNWVADGVLAAVDYDFDGKATVPNYDDKYIALADNAKVFFINTTTNACTELTAAQVKEIGSTAPVSGFVASNDQYGYATVVYVLHATSHKGA